MKMTRVCGIMIICMSYYAQAVIVCAPGKPLGYKQNQNRESSYPYISGDSFRDACDFIFDETYIPLNTDSIRTGDTIFVKTDFIGYFFKHVHPYIHNRYILVTHNSDYLAPGAYSNYLNDKKLIAWFGQNSDIMYHPKFFPIPIGLANRYWGHGNINEVSKAQALRSDQRDILLYLNFSDANNKERGIVRNLFETSSFCTKAPRKAFSDYLEDVTHTKFVLCPTGNGLDCHRQWETLLMGAIPVMTHSTLDPLFERLPIVIVNDWQEVTQDFLHATYSAMQQQNFAQERMLAPYWITKIKEAKRHAQQKM